MAVDEVLTDNGPSFCSNAFAELLAQRAIKHRRTRPYRPQTNGKAERFNRTLTDEFLYNYNSDQKPTAVSASNAGSTTTTVTDTTPPIGGPPASRANNLTPTDS